MTTEVKLRYEGAKYMWIRWLHIPFFFLQVKVGFTVKASPNIGGSIADLSKKNKGSIVSLQKVLFALLS